MKDVETKTKKQKSQEDLRQKEKKTTLNKKSERELLEYRPLPCLTSKQSDGH